MTKVKVLKPVPVSFGSLPVGSFYIDRDGIVCRKMPGDETGGLGMGIYNPDDPDWTPNDMPTGGYTEYEDSYVTPIKKVTFEV